MRALVLTTAILAGCQAPGTDEHPGLDGQNRTPVELTSVPFFPQETDQCGPAALATVLNAAGVETSMAATRADVYLPGRRGSVQVEMRAAIRRRGLVPLAIAPRFDVLLKELRTGRPVLVFQNLGFKRFPRWHYAVVVGYEPDLDAVILRSGPLQRHLQPRKQFLKTWQRADRWGLVVLPAGDIPSWVAAEDYLLAIAEIESAGDIDFALVSYQAAVERWPDRSNAWLGLGNSYYARGELRAAVDAFDRAVAANPDDPVAANNLAHVLGETGCAAAGLAVLDRAVTQTPAWSALLAETRGELERLPATAGDCERVDS